MATCGDREWILVDSWSLELHVMLLFELQESRFEFSRWWFQIFLFSPVPGEMIQFD